MTTPARLALCALILAAPILAAPILTAPDGLIAGEPDRPTAVEPDRLAGLRGRLATKPFAALAAGDGGELAIAPADLGEARRVVEAAYRKEAGGDAARREAHEKRALRHGSATMRFSMAKAGERPEAGYPLYIALHGGGGAPSRLNDGQWRHMGIYYRRSVKQGVYVAPRGVADTWNLHFRGESYPLYDRLIENMVLYEGVDPNRVYLLGFSAGGDGVYQIVPRMADRWAAANMSAGHHNGTSPRSLHGVPFLLQVGQRDAAYGRNRETVKFWRKLETLRKKHPAGYVHEIFVHAGRPHNFLDNHPGEAPQRVLADPGAWLDGKESAAVERNTNAIAWVSRHRRDPVPDVVVWDLGTWADRTSGGDGEDGDGLHRGSQRYWLDIAGRDPKSLGAPEIVARLDREANAVVVETAGKWLRILLTSRRLDIARPITVRVGGREIRGKARPRLAVMARTILERGDPLLMFEAECVVEKGEDGWKVTGLDG